MSILGLDYGEKRIGVARSDELLLMSHPVAVIESKSREEISRRLNGFVEEFSVTKVVVGLPKTLKGELGPKAKEVLEFVEFLRGVIHCEVITWDERFSTVQAEKQLLAHDVSRAKRKEKRDILAAQIILQSYLDYLRNQGKSSCITNPL